MSNATDRGCILYECLQEPSSNIFTFLPWAVSVLTIPANAIQFGFLRTKFRCEINTLFVIIQNLCLADLLCGISTFITILIKFLQWKVISNQSGVTLITQFLSQWVAPYFFMVSTIILNALAILKMFKVTNNVLHGRKFVRRLCYCMWGIIFVPSTINYTLHRENIIERKLSQIFIPLLVFPSIFLQCYCFGRIWYTTSRKVKRISKRADGKVRFIDKFLKIAGLQILAFVLCQSPVSASYLLRNINVGEKIRLIFVGIAQFQSVIDPVMFFIVFRHKWKRPQRQEVAVKFNLRLAYVIPRPKLGEP